MHSEQPESGAPRDDLDQTVADSFPASDPPSHTPPSGAGQPAQGRGDVDTHDAGAAGEAIPKGTPTNDRHGAETASARIDGQHKGQGLCPWTPLGPEAPDPHY